MKVTDIHIENYKSIENIDFPLSSYGKGKHKSSTAVLIGINESGKSSILQAISLLKDGITELDYNEDCLIDVQDDNKYIDIYTYLDFSTFEEEQFIKCFSPLINLT